MVEEFQVRGITTRFLNLGSRSSKLALGRKIVEMKLESHPSASRVYHGAFITVVKGALDRKECRFSDTLLFLEGTPRQKLARVLNR